MTALDFNDAAPQFAGAATLIPEDTVAVVAASLRPGGHGPGNWLKPSGDGSCLMADFEFTIDGGEFDRRKFWSLFVTEGTTEGQQKAAAISRSRIRAMLESARGVSPSDDSPAAQKARQVDGWQALDGLRFCARIGVETGKVKNPATGERYADKNVLKAAVTPEQDEYISPGPQAANTSKPAGAAAAPASKPAWAR